MTIELRGELETSAVEEVSLILAEGVRPKILRGGEYFYGWAWAIDMTDDKSVLVYGTREDDVVRTYDWVDPAWVKRGSDLDDAAANDDFGSGVQISGDGNTLVVSEPRKDNGGTLQVGALRRYTRNGSSWDFDNEYLGTGAANTGLGEYLAMDTDADIAIAGTWNNTFETYDWGGSSWTQRSGGIKAAPTSTHGTVVASTFGENLSCSSDGTIVATTYRVTGTYTNDVYLVRVFDWSGSAWVDVGAEIIGPLGTDEETCVGIFLSADGLKLYSLWNDSQAAYAGVANLYIYDWVDPNWVLNVSEGTAYDPLEDYSALGDRIGLWVSADENITAMLLGDTSDIGFYGYAINQLGDCVRKFLGESDIGVIGTICVPEITPPYWATMPQNVPVPPGTLFNPDNPNCSFVDFYGYFAANDGDGPDSANQDYRTWLLENYWSIYIASGICNP